MYRGDAASFPPSRRVPNWPAGGRSAMLFDPTKVCAIPTSVPASDAAGLLDDAPTSSRGALDEHDLPVFVTNPAIRARFES